MKNAHDKRTKPEPKTGMGTFIGKETPFNPEHRKVTVVLLDCGDPSTDPVDILVICKMVLDAFRMMNLVPVSMNGSYVQTEINPETTKRRVVILANETGQAAEDEDFFYWSLYYAGVEEGQYFIVEG